MSRHLTVGVDGSAESLRAAEWAADEALLRGVDLRMVFVDQWSGSAPGPSVALEQHQWADKVLADAASDVAQDRPGIEVATVRQSGRPASVLAAQAAEADMLVLGSRGLGRVKGFLVGSVGLATIGATDRPVVLVRGAQHPDDERPDGRWRRDVVVGVDVHHACDALLAFAFEEAARHGCTLRAVYGWSLPPVVRDACALAAAERDMGPDIARRLADMLLPWRERFPSVDVVECTPVGGPTMRLLHAAGDADLVVVGRRARRAPLGTHIGSVAHAVLHHCPAPVAVIAHD
ncbi:universal stress protein [Streptomyces chromofuscus]|uniref:Universal stress protein n=1 Tax=Streptomyces chromofuscus TaxID=42881 RepID=A0A7M2TAE1_STRCW|nr:universal stress protein [Streptomyces chromofuscus]QOV44688.1 universal stress protein [Streptomyces chromofuscus]GGT01117.1 stress-inducible protein [Streptomyces chromofuscus]